MKKYSRLLLLMAGLGLAIPSTYGTTYNYSYRFDDGTADGFTVTGTLEGDQNGDFVENVANVTVSFEGISMTPVSTVKFTGSTWVDGPVVSFDALMNNFLFIDTDDYDEDGDPVGYSWFFYMINPPVYDRFLASAYNAGLYYYYDAYDFILGSWSLTAVSTSAPDGGLTLAMFGLAMTGLTWLRRRL